MIVFEEMRLSLSFEILIVFVTDSLYRRYGCNSAVAHRIGE